MPKYDKVPRKKKKAIKKASGLQGQKTSKKQVVDLANKEAAKQKRAAATVRRYNANKKFLEDLGIPTSIITKSTSTKETKNKAHKYLAEQKKEQREVKQAHLVARKINRLIEAGFSYDEANKMVGSFWRPISDKKLDEVLSQKITVQNPVIDATYVTSNYLYVGAAEIRGGFHAENFDGFTNAELAAQIHDRINEASDNPDDSNSLYSVYQVYSGSKERMNHVASVYYKRGYNMDKDSLKLDSKQYMKLTISNRWNEHGFYSMVLNCINQMKNEDVKPFIREMNRYCKQNNLPFMENLNKKY